MIFALKYPLMQFSPIFTGAAGSPLTATIVSFLVATINPQPVPQNLQTDLSHFHPAAAVFAAASRLSGTLIPAAVAAATAAVVFRSSLLDSAMSSLLLKGKGGAAPAPPVTNILFRGSLRSQRVVNKLYPLLGFIH